MGEEVMISFETYWIIFSNFFASKYFVAVIAFAIAITFLKQEKKQESYNFLYTINTIFPFVIVINSLIFLFNLLAACYGQNLYEWYAFHDAILTGIKLQFMLLVLGNLVPLIFFIRKTRVNLLITLAVILLGNAGLLFSLIKQHIFSYRDNMPSSWYTYCTETFITNLVCWIGFVLLFAFTYWVEYKRKKLPYPSIISK